MPVSQLSALPVPTSVASDASSASQSSTSPPLVTDEPPTAVEPAQPKVIAIVNVSVATFLLASVAVYAYTADPAVVGVPDSVRVPALNDSPAGGSGPSAYVTVPSPPVAAGSTRFMIAVCGVYLWFATVAVPKSGGLADGVPLATADHSPVSVAVVARRARGTRSGW